ncbi:MAG: hypothetical protein M3O36_04465 [Myxococcota bacterium]|nr:hypothetical protein [Myxococcota bacterium]
MTCNNLKYAASDYLWVHPAPGQIDLRVGADVAIWTEVMNSGVAGDQSRFGSVRFSWQQTGINAPIVLLPSPMSRAAPGSANPLGLSAPVGPQGSRDLNTFWTPLRTQVGGPGVMFPSGTLWATAITTEIAGGPVEGCPPYDQPPASDAYSAVAPITLFDPGA